MNRARTLLKWISKHRVLSALIAIILAAVLITARVLSNRTRGILSPPLERSRIVESVYGIGTVTANQSFQLRPGVISTIEALYVKEGDKVIKGQKLALINGVIYRAPFTGTVTYLPFKVGENVFAQGPVLSLVNLLDRYLVVNLEQQAALRVRRGQEVKMSFDTLRKEAFDGVVESVYSNGNDFLSRIDISYLPAFILPGMTADVAITLRTKENALLAPVAAIEQNSVWVKRGHGIPRPVPIQVGIVDGAMAEIASGDVRAGDRVLIRRKLQ